MTTSFEYGLHYRIVGRVNKYYKVTYCYDVINVTLVFNRTYLFINVNTYLGACPVGRSYVQTPTNSHWSRREPISPACYPA